MICSALHHLTAARAVLAVSHGLQRLNNEVSAWMRGELMSGRKARPPLHAMG